MKKRPLNWPMALFGLSLLFILVRALEKILSTYTKEYEQDPIKHNVYAFASHSFVDMVEQIKGLFQPALDFSLRRYLVFPIFGFDERSFRIPGTICFILAICLVPLAVHIFLKRQGHPLIASLIGGIWSALWILENKLLLTYGVEGRHYMAAALVSMAWFSCVFFFDSKPRWVFFLLSLVFANTHLFSLPLLAAGFGLEAVHSLRERNWKDIRELVLAGIAIVILTVVINYPAFSALTERPPGAATRETLWSALPAAWKLWLHFLELLELPLGRLLLALGVVGALTSLRRAGFLVIFGIAFPLFLAHMRTKSNYPFSDRYYLPFFGIGMITIAFGCDALLRAFRYVGQRAALRRPEFVSLAALVLALAWAFPGKDVLRTFTDLHRIRIPNRHFTDGYKYYSQIRALPAPKLVIFRYVKQQHSGERHVPDYYLVANRQPGEPDVAVIAARTKGFAKNKAQVHAFWRKHAEATVVFDRPKCKAGASKIGRVIKSKKRCSVIVPGVKEQDFEPLMKRVGATLKG